MTDAPEKPAPRPWLALAPIVIFGLLALIFWIGLSRDPSELPSALIGKPAPEMSLPPIAGLDVPSFDGASLRQGGVTIVNVWASWCGPCRIEHPLLTELSKRTDIRLVGINYKDQPDNARRFLGRYGNPYAAVGADSNGRASIDWGVYGVPETFVVGKDGRIAYKLVGPITTDNIETTLKPAIAKALGAN